MVRGAWVAGVLLIAVMVTGCLADGGSPNASGVRVIELTMVEPFGYDPSVVEVRQGETVHFVVRNPTPIAHEMYIGSELEQGTSEAEHRGASPPAGATHLGYGIYVVARGTGTLDYTFSHSGDILIGCHLPGHYAAGHVATIHVLPSEP
jgi:uncharacterized cupredoxin-like copper-binding protein